MPTSLWRHTLQEHSAGLFYHRVVRVIFTVIATLGLGSVAYAMWITFALMSGDDLQNAVAAFGR